MLNAIMLSVANKPFMLSVFLLNVIMLRVVMPNGSPVSVDHIMELFGSRR